MDLPFAVDIIIVAAWAIWIVRNNKIFKQITPSFVSWKEIYATELTLLKFRMKKSLLQYFKDWLSLAL